MEERRKESSSFVDVATVNTEYLVEERRKHATTKEFLHFEVHIPFHSCKIDAPLLHTNQVFDIDGVVLEIDQLKAIRGRLHYLFLPKLEAHMMKNHYFILRKHLPLD